MGFRICWGLWCASCYCGTGRKKVNFEVPEKEVSNFVVLLAFFGVFLGGRVGYVLFYDFGSFLENPLSLLMVWKGGMTEIMVDIEKTLSQQGNHSLLSLHSLPQKLVEILFYPENAFTLS